ncbi:M20/M25/M40 family metallo-hydrolase [Paludibaculum fermentans]|uniref:M20/M25/M40 family metallo-hydrolase n=1 Tax=Paludibaculum fermentans TaxID=1473598 RepID=A0A7S7NL42_PALFE|nr:M20/M25/M40 family metallo-hydrolase [Paludibaculum fermentans]QOY85636.1 M20/M25/M40 family metallo-hydrolase [Paludibaculum fermentans]
MTPALEQQLISYVSRNREALIGILADLVRCPSENTPPTGNEGNCQQYLFDALQQGGYQPELYAIDEVPGLHAHPIYHAGRDYNGRPNLVARRQGVGGGRSLILSGHIDTVPRGTQNWTADPFSGHVAGNRLYGRGSNDMKAGIASNLFVAQALSDLGIQLQGDLCIESVVDEEFGGVNGTLAARVAGITADAAVISEPSSLRVCAAQRGGRTAHITFHPPGDVIEQVTHFLVALREFAAIRRTASIHPLYADCQDAVPVSVTKIFTSPWGTGEPIGVPQECRLELFWQLMPGEEQAAVESQFEAWFEDVLSSAYNLYRRRPTLEYPIRWLPGSAISAEEPAVRELRSSAAKVLPAPPPVTGIEGPCDLYVFHEFGIPAVLWGACGTNGHGPDESVDLDSVVTATQALLLFVCQWCGVQEESQ